MKAILDNPRYTGYAVFGRWARQERLLDPDDVAAGHVVRFRRASAEKVVRSREPAHPAIVSVEEFTQAQLQRRAKAAGGLPRLARVCGAADPRHRDVPAAWSGHLWGVQPPYAGRHDRQGAYYRCTTRTMAPGSLALADHPLTVNLREDHVVEVINDWLNELFARENRDATVAALLDGQSGVPTPDMDEAKARRADADARLRRYQRAIGAGVDPAALVDAINQAQAERTAAQAYIDSAPLDDTLDVAEVYAMLDAYNELVDGLRDATGRPTGPAVPALDSRCATCLMSGRCSCEQGPV